MSDRRPLFELPDGFIADATGFPFDITPDDQRFIMQRLVAGVTPRMVLIENWGEEVKARVRGQRR
ncbi:MAG: hypothetical protein Q8N53_14195 [Longimicrobiales bacterium]|nr:hypothetical protein [Longimicrobiales bacterium]